MIRRHFLLVFTSIMGALVHPIALVAQSFEISNGSDQTCVGAFLDSGGQGGGGYGNNENFTYTLCPDNPGDAISVDFLTFNLSTAGAAPIDGLTIYDGNNTGAPLIGNYTGTSLQGVVISAGLGNPSGCLTFVWESNATGTGVFAGAITCYLPCDRPTAAATFGQAIPLKICQGEQVDFDASASFAAPGFSIVDYIWDFDDGTTSTTATPFVSHNFADPGEYVVQLQVIDDNGCSSTNLTDLAVWVGTTPNFNGTGGALIGCLGEELCIDGIVNALTWNGIPSVDLGSGVYLPDNVGSCFTSELTFSQFAPGQSLNNINDLQQICLDIEHSFMGDLVIDITSPTGENVILHQQGGGGTFLGDANDNDNNANPVPGTCWTYCFSPSATNGTWVDNSTFGPTPNTVPSSQGTALAPGTYESLNPLSGLVGSLLNGIWTIRICDLWGLDNGFLCGWNIDLDPSLYPSLTEFTPVYGAGCDSSSWSGPNISFTSPECNGICVTPNSAGDFDYVYTVVDDFGCTYDTTITVTILPDPIVDAGPDVTTCTTPVQLNAIASGGLPVDCDYTLDMFDTFGDGWNGGEVTITVNGVPNTYTLANGSAGTVTIPITSGDPIEISYSSGFFNGEVSFNLLDDLGNLLYSSGLGPANGVLWTGTASCNGLSTGFVYSWDPPTGLSDPNIADPVATPGSTTVYCVTVSQVGHSECSATDCMTITVETDVTAGTDTTISICSSDAAFDMFALLGGPPDPGGSWEDPSNSPTDSIFDPVDHAAGVYLYIVPGSGNCGPLSDTAIVTINVSILPDAGMDGSITLCSSDAAVDLFNSLGGTPDPGGSWTAPGGGAFGGILDPAIDIAGIYTYTAPGIAPCPDETSEVTVTINLPPDPGTDGSITLCSSDAAVDLFNSLGGTPDVGGSWTAPGGGAFGGILDPAIDIAGIYTYTAPGIAPCPDETSEVTVTINLPPDPGTDGSITLCSSDAAVDLFNSLGGTPDVGGTWTAPGGGAFGGILDPAVDIAGAYTYTSAGIAPCPDESSEVTVSINIPPNPGTDGSITLCSSDAAVDLFTLLGGTPDIGGSWTAPGGGAFSGLLDPAVDLAGIYTYLVAGIVPCPDETSEITVTINDPPDAGTDGNITVCSSDAVLDLFSLLGGTPDPGGTWTAPGGTAFGGILDPANDLSGAYIYVVTGVAPCPDESSEVTVTINTPPDPGTNGTITLCSTGAITDLFTLLGGTPDAGGSWIGPGGGAFSGNLNPAIDIAGVYTYTVTGTAPCPNESADVTVTINTPPDPGANGNITLCTSDPIVDLFTLLGGTPDAGGIWTAPGGGVFSGNLDPSIDPSGVYTYTVVGIAPCPDESSIVTVTINTPPDPGIDGIIILCSSDAPIDLFNSLGGTPDAGGSWSAPGGGAFGGILDPAIDVAGVYTYTASGIAPCPDETSEVTVTINIPPDPGTDGSITLCSSDATMDLFTLLGGTPDVGGSWTAPGGAFSGTLDPAVDPSGVYTYTLSGTLPCPNLSSDVMVSINPAVNAGLDGSIALCISSPPADLFTELGGTPDLGGSWTDPGGTPFGGSFDPSSDPPGIYTYTVAGTSPCPDDLATVTVNVVSLPDPGTPGSENLCSNGVPIDLFNELGGTPDLGGAWTAPGGAPFFGLFDPSSDVAGVYTYTITVPPPCVSVSSTVTMSLVSPPNPGSDNALTLCISSPATNLFGVLGGSPDAGGSWTAPGGAPFSGIFDPSTDVPGVYTYTVNGTAPCPDESATVTVSVVSLPDPGTPGNITLCTSGAVVDLFNSLGGTPDAGGNWTAPGGAAFSGNFDPATDAAGIYTYTITVPPPCVSQSSTVTVSLNTPPDPGIDDALTLCISSPAEDLFNSLGGTPDAGGIWTAPGGAAFSGNFDPANDVPGIYTYTVAGTAPCPDESATVTVSVVSLPDPGTPGNITLCTSGAVVDLFNSLGGTPDAGGSWTAPGGAAFSGSFDPATDAAGIYIYTITVPPPCVSQSSTVTVSLNTPPDPGIDDALTLCISSPAEDLFNSLGGTPDASGSWTAPGGAPFSGIFDPSTDVPGVYTYTVNGTAPCPDESATVTVSVVSLPDPGTPGNITLCTSGAVVDLFNSLGGTPDAGGLWSDPGGLAFTGMFDPSSDQAGIYTYTITVPLPCVSQNSTVTVSLNEPPDPGIDDALTLCISSPATNLFDVLGGTPDAGGVWTAPGGAPFSGNFDPSSDVPGVYTYTVAGTAPCPDESATITVAVSTAPDAGQDVVLNLCVNGAAVALFPELGGTPDPGGSWIDPNGMAFSGIFDPNNDPDGDYTYSIAAQPPCPGAQAIVTINTTTDPDAGTPGQTTVCGTDTSFDLFALLGGTPDAGGTWSDPNGQAHSGVFDPSSDISGTYEYFVFVPLPCISALSFVDIDVIPPPNAGTNASITVCSSDPAFDLYNLLGGSPDLGGSWADSGGNAFSGMFIPGNSTPGNYFYTVLGQSPCADSISMVSIDVELLPNAGMNNSLTVCPDALPVDLFDLLGGNPDPGGVWTDPNGQMNNGIFDPANDPQGAYTYTVSGIIICPDSLADATVSIFIIAPPEAGPDMIVCELIVQLGATGNWSAGIWSGPPNITFTDPADPATIASSSIGGAFVLYWTVSTLDGCFAEDSLSVTFTDEIIPVIATSDAVCNGYCDGTATVSATGGNVQNSYTYSWLNNIAGPNDANANGLCVGNYSVTVLDDNGCSQDIGFVINEPPMLVIDLITAVDETCPGSCDGTITVTDPEGVLFSFDNGQSFQTSNQLTGSCAGIYGVVMMDANGCLASGSAAIDSPAPVIADFIPMPIAALVSNPTINFQNSSLNANIYNWDFGGLGFSSDVDPSFTFPGVEGAEYLVCLTAMNDVGCVDTTCQLIQILDLVVVHVPNAFTPDDDGWNDGFAPVFNDPTLVQDYNFRIFDRWGELLFESIDPSRGWDGTVDGVPVKVDVYAWQLIYKDIRSFDKDALFGHVTVVR